MPTHLARDVSILLTRELKGFQRELELFPDDETAWRTCPGVSNAAANLALHVAGNLQYYVGTMLGGTGYVRDRAAEFGRRSGSRQEVMAELGRAITTVEGVLLRLSDADLEGTFEATGIPPGIPTRRLLMQLCSHAAYHLAQAGYLRRILTADARSSGALSLTPLVDG